VGGLGAQALFGVLDCCVNGGDVRTGVGVARRISEMTRNSALDGTAASRRGWSVPVDTVLPVSEGTQRITAAVDSRKTAN
jgi:hypothetical protein